MFSDTFYPTPKDVIQEMLTGIRFGRDELILDPSAGKGDILDYITDYYYSNNHDGYRSSVYACEIVPELRAILEDKGYPVMADDFLRYKPTLYFTKIVMNPPFDHAEDHIFHAFEVLGHGQVVSLIPTSSLEGKNSKEQLLSNMIDKHGAVRDIGQVFRYAERPTSENISVITLNKEEDPFNLDFEPENDREYSPSFSIGPDKELAIPGFIPGLLAQYNAAFACVDEYLGIRIKIEKYVLKGYEKGTDPLDGLDGGETIQGRYNAFTTRMNMLAWQQVLDHPNFQSILTERAREMVKRFRSRQRHMDFNDKNIISMFEQIRALAPDLLDAAVQDAFDEFTKYYKGNRDHWEGWKSDLAWKVARKVVLPWCADSWSIHRDVFHIGYEKREKFNDVDRALSLISGKPYSDLVKITDVLEGAPFGKKVYSTFFEITGYKKGTVHLVFRDEKILNDFNFKAAQGKGWLPDGTQSRFDF